MNQLRVFNLRHGMDPSLEVPSARYGSTPVDGPNVGMNIMEQWEMMLTNYRRLMGWDEKTGIPKKKTLNELGLGLLKDDI